MIKWQRINVTTYMRQKKNPFYFEITCNIGPRLNINVSFRTFHSICYTSLSSIVKNGKYLYIRQKITKKDYDKKDNISEMQTHTEKYVHFKQIARYMCRYRLQSSRDSEKNSFDRSYVFACRRQMSWRSFGRWLFGVNRSAELNRTRASNRAVRCIAVRITLILLGGRGRGWRYCTVMPCARICDRRKYVASSRTFPTTRVASVQFHSRRVADANTRCILSQCSIALCSLRGGGLKSARNAEIGN